MIRERIERGVLGALLDRAPLHVLELAERLDEHPVSVDQVCARLHEDGKISPVGCGTYDVTDRGRRHHEATAEDHRQPECGEQ